MSEAGAPRAAVASEFATRLAGLEKGDELGCEHVHDLLVRADALGGRAGALLRSRAAARLVELEARDERVHGRRRVDPAPGRDAQRAASPHERESSARCYREAAADWTAVASLARAVDRVPRGAGLLNGQRLAARALQAAGALSPAYLRSLTSSLADLAPLLSLPEIRPPRRRSR